ncbi:MAG: carbohydrate-binding protein [Elusimicrobia bacterium]|nr:carbohydrate-binding protein [Elusimicrobiota bacterium]
MKIKRMMLLFIISFLFIGQMVYAAAQLKGSWINFGDYDSIKRIISGLFPLYGCNIAIVRVWDQYDYVGYPIHGTWYNAAKALELGNLGRANGIKVIPEVQFFGHQASRVADGDVKGNFLLAYPQYDENRGGQPVNDSRSLCPNAPGIAAIVCGMAEEIALAFGNHAICIGFDEVYNINVCSLCKATGRTNGQQFVYWLNIINNYLQSKGIEVYMYGDMLIPGTVGLPYDQQFYPTTHWTASPDDTWQHIDEIEHKENITINDWHYDDLASYPSIPYFGKKGFKVNLSPGYDGGGTPSFVNFALNSKGPKYYNTAGIVFWGMNPSDVNYLLDGTGAASGFALAFKWAMNNVNGYYKPLTGSQPVISAVTSNVAGNSATITWTTDVPCDSQVQYSQERNTYNNLITTYTNITTLDTNLVTSHSVPITGLQSGKTYHFNVITKNVTGYAVSPDNTFGASITVTYPNGGENLLINSQQTVTWGSVGVAGNVKIELSVDGGTTWSTLVANTANDGSEVVTLPNSPSSTCLIRLSAISGGTTDSSDANFSIVISNQITYGNNGNLWQISSVLLSATTIQAENYDTGGEGVAYHDTTAGNSGNAYRISEDVDIENCNDIGGGYDVGWTKAGEWLEYSINVNEGGEYQIILRTARQPAVNDIVHFEFTQNDVVYFITPSVSLPATGGWGIWTDTEVVNSVTLLPGNQIMKLVFDPSAATDCSNVNYIKIIKLTADTTPPEVSAISTTSITGSGAVVTWTTNEAANSKVQYGTTLPYSSTTTLANFVTSHSVPITGLTEKTLYHYRIITADISNNPTTTGDYIFTTTANDPDAPVISNVHAGVTVNSAAITWTTNEPSDSQVAYGLTTALGSTTTLITTLVTDHSVPISNLEKGKTYYYTIYSRDAATNLATSALYQFSTYNLQHRIYTYFYDDSTTPANLQFLLQVYNDENILVTDYGGTLTIKTKDSNGAVLDTINSTFIKADSGEKDVSIPFSKNVDTIELTGDTTTTIVINFSDLYISKLVGSKGGTIKGINGIKIVVPSGVLSTNKYLATKRTSVPPVVGNTLKYVNTVNPICYDFGELTFNNNAPTLQNQVFTRAVNITIPYTAADIGTLNEDGLRIYYWTGTDWDLVTGVQTVDKVNNTVTAIVKHFSTYRILGSYVSVDLSKIKIYPNPFNPNTAINGMLKVINLPINCVMKLYSVNGELIRELKELDFGNLGWLEWDGKNADGDKVARAVYIYQIEDTAGGRKTGKIGLVK